jgi:hypothetical protein
MIEWYQRSAWLKDLIFHCDKLRIKQDEHELKIAKTLEDHPDWCLAQYANVNINLGKNARN